MNNQDHNNKTLWPLALSTFGMFMIMAAPIAGEYGLMIFSGLSFTILGFVILAIQKKKK
ncbi:MAG: hypothetical protein ACRDBX_07805 [Erysipelotrichaceae bacterium]